MRILILCALALFSRPAFADWPSSHVFWDDALLMGHGKSKFGVNLNYYDLSYQKGSHGIGAGYGSELNKVSWSDLFPFIKPSDVIKIKEKLNDGSISEKSSALLFDFTVNKKVLEISPFITFGLTKKWTLGIKLPLFLTQVKIESDVQFINTDSSIDTIGLRVSQQVKTHKKKIINSQLEKEDFDPLVSREKKLLVGDIKILGKYLLLDQEVQRLIFKAELIYPASMKKDPYSFVDTSVSDGQVDSSVALIYKKYWLGGISFISQAKHIIQWPDKISSRSFLSESSHIESEIKRDLGDYIQLFMDVDYYISHKFKMNVGYIYQSDFKDEFISSQGPFFETKEKIHLAKIGLTYHLTKNTKVQNLAQLNLYMPMTSIDDQRSPMSRMELILAF